MDSQVSKFLEVLVRIRELRISNEITKSMFPDALIGDMWVDAIDKLLECFDIPESDRKVFWTVTEP